MGIQANTLTHLQEIYFDVCDLLNGQSYQELRYETRNEMLEEFKWKLERIEEELRVKFGALED